MENRDMTCIMVCVLVIREVTDIRSLTKTPVRLAPGPNCTGYSFLKTQSMIPTI